MLENDVNVKDFKLNFGDCPVIDRALRPVCIFLYMQEKNNLKVIFLFECPWDKPLEKINIVDKYMLEND